MSSKSPVNGLSIDSRTASGSASYGDAVGGIVSSSAAGAAAEGAVVAGAGVAGAGVSFWPEHAVTAIAQTSGRAPIAERWILISLVVSQRCGRRRCRCAIGRRSRPSPPGSPGRPACRGSRRRWRWCAASLSPLLNASPFSSQAPGEDRSAHEIRQPAELVQVAAGQDVVVVAADLAVVERAEVERRAERELIGRQRTVAERRAAAAERRTGGRARRPAPEAAGFPGSCVRSTLERPLSQRRRDVGAVEDVLQVRVDAMVPRLGTTGLSCES